MGRDGCELHVEKAHRATRQRIRLAAIPHGMACFGAAAGETWAARGEHHEPAPAGAGQCFRRSGGVPEGLKLVPLPARNDADDAHWKA